MPDLPTRLRAKLAKLVAGEPANPSITPQKTPAPGSPDPAAQKKDPASVEALLTRAKASFDAKTWDQALDDYRTLYGMKTGEHRAHVVMRYANVLRTLKRLDDSDRVLAVGLAESPTNGFLLAELAGLRMHQRRWSDAWELWSQARVARKRVLTAANYACMAKTCEQLEQWADHRAVLEEGLKQHPTESDLFARLVFNDAVQFRQRAQWLEGSRSISLFESIYRPKLWPVDAKLRQTVWDDCCRHAPLRSAVEENDPLTKYVLAVREDGLGERLNAFLTGIVLSKRLGYPFGFRWADSMHTSALANGQGANVPNVVGHAVVPARELFARTFIERHGVGEEIAARRYREIQGSSLSLVDIDRIEREANLHGWHAPRVSLSTIVTPNLATTKGFSYGDAFAAIEFAPEIQHSIDAARGAPLPGAFAALHLRSGDVFYGEYRKFVHYTYKGMTLPIAKAAIQRLQSAGLGVVIFGQDRDVLEYLKREFGAMLAMDLVPDSCTTDTQRAMFEIVLMSRAQRIIAGSSGFAKIAGWIGGSEVELHTRLFPGAEQASLSARDLEDNAGSYHPLQAAFGYWYAYFVARKDTPYERAVALLEKAREYDRDNQLYAFVLAALHFRHGFADRAERVLEDLVTHELAVHVGVRLPGFDVLSAKTFDKYNLDEWLPDYVAAKNVETPFTMMVVAWVLHMQGQGAEAAQHIDRCFAMFPARTIDDFHQLYLR